jgi:outer membrane lipoprotein LolB
MVAERPGGHLTKPFFLNVFLVLLLTGCQTQNRLPQVDHDFAIEGKLAVRSIDGQHAARFRWQQDGRSYRIELWGPLGQGRTILEGDGHRLRILDASGKTLESGKVRRVMEKRLGWYLPLETLPEWVLGGPIAAIPVDQPHLDAVGRMTGFVQLGWTLTYGYPGQSRTPRKITAVKNEYRIILIVQPVQPGRPAPAER